MVKVGVFSAQGAVTEHIYMLRKTFEEMDIQGKAILVKSREEAREIDGIIIPGGESTTISRLLERTGVGEAIIHRGWRRKGKIPGFDGYESQEKCLWKTKRIVRSRSRS